MSIFLAFAATFPEVQVYLMFIIPIKVKDITNKYEVVYEDFEFETAELE